LAKKWRMLNPIEEWAGSAFQVVGAAPTAEIRPRVRRAKRDFSYVRRKIAVSRDANHYPP